jgi:chemotaxis response regulator CheB
MFKVEQSVVTVGIGASAGGLEAFKGLLESLPVDTGLSLSSTWRLVKKVCSQIFCQDLPKYLSK